MARPKKPTKMNFELLKKAGRSGSEEAAMRILMEGGH
jgi:hypothetical protein